MNSMCRNGALGIVLSVAAMAAFAQSAPSAPATVGVQPAAADEAMQKAVPRKDTATVVRTAPSITNKASAAMAPAATTNTTTVAPDASNAAMAQDSTMAATTKPMRKARADRN